MDTMNRLNLNPDKRKLRLLCLGAHSDDIEIGCGGTIFKWFTIYNKIEVTWVVLCATGLRIQEAKDSANAILAEAQRYNLIIQNFHDGYLPTQYDQIKDFFEELKISENPDIVFTHYLKDRHQDHRLISELTWQTFRNHLIFEYEIPKYEGDLGQPNLFVPLSENVARLKVDHLTHHFITQHSKRWYRSELFMGLMQLRGIECRSDSGFAEAFHVRKIIV